MKRLVGIILIQLTISSLFCQTNIKLMPYDPQNTIETKHVPDKEDRNNNFYDNEETFELKIPEIEIFGEIENPGKADFSKLIKRSVIVKETLLKPDGSNAFVGAYRYDGYSLFDLLNDRILKKNNVEEFRPIIDMYVEIENDRDEKVVVSWGEIYYPNFLHNIIIATNVMRIVPSKTKDLWPLPTESKLVFANDLVTERNISSPSKITIRSYKRSYLVNRELNPLYSEEVLTVIGDKLVETFNKVPSNLQKETLHTIFYGKGRGIHSTRPFTGIYMKDYLVDKVSLNQRNLREGLVVFAGIDGYRSVYSFSEIMNRNDQAEVLLVPCAEEKDGGKFRIFPSCDFFSDRAVKALSEIRIDQIRNP
jgi:hypothetical protein